MKSSLIKTSLRKSREYLIVRTNPLVARATGFIEITLCTIFSRFATR